MYNWCHGPSCHTNHTQSRIRGSGDNKVLRTIKIKQGGSYRTHEHYSMFNYFCNQSCLMDFIRTHLQSIVAIAPRREALETPIKVGVETRTDYYGHEYKTKVISKIDND
jgi:hypothetical protein